MKFNGERALMSCFFIIVALELWKWFKSPDPNSTVPLPPPYVFTGVAIIYGGLSLVGDFFSYQVAGAFAIALTVAIAMAQLQQIQNLKPAPGIEGNAGPVPLGPTGPVKGTTGVSRKVHG